MTTNNTTSFLKLRRYDLHTTQSESYMREREDGDWIKADDAQMMIDHLEREVRTLETQVKAYEARAVVLETANNKLSSSINETHIRANGLQAELDHIRGIPIEPKPFGEIKHMTTNKHEKLLNLIRQEFGKLGSPIDGKVITLVGDQWRVDGSFMNPLSLFAVVNKNGGDWEWLDMLSGRWSGVVSQQCLTQNKILAERMAIMYQADVEKYSLVHNP